MRPFAQLVQDGMTSQQPRFALTPFWFMHDQHILLPLLLLSYDNMVTLSRLVRFV